MSRVPETARWRAEDWLLMVTVVLLAAWLRTQLVSNGSFDLKPRPDALEYSAVAANLAEGEGWSLPIGGLHYPSRYPYGTSLVLMPAVWFAGGDPAYGFCGILLLGLAAVAMTYGLTRSRTGPAGAFLAAVIVAACPRIAVHSVLPMSEVPSVFALFLLCGYFLWWTRAPRADWHLGALGLIAALAASIRWANVLALVPVALQVLLEGKRRLRRLGWMAAGVLAGLAPEWYYRFALFGSPTQTGYHFWEPDSYGSWRTSYNPKFLFESARKDEWAYGNVEFYARGLSGYRDVLWTEVSAVLAAGGAWFAFRRRGDPWARWMLLLPAVSVAFYLPYFFRDQRMNIVILPFLAVLAGLCTDRLLGRLSGVAAWCVQGLLVAGVLLSVGWGDAWGVAGILRDDLHSAAQTRGQILHPELVQAGAALPAGTLLIADLAHLQLRTVLDEETEVITFAAERADEEVRLIYLHDLQSLEERAGDVPEGTRPRALFVDGKIDEAVFQQVAAAARAGRHIECWTTPRTNGYLFEYAPILRRRFSVEVLSEAGDILTRGRLLPLAEGS